MKGTTIIALVLNGVIPINIKSSQKGTILSSLLDSLRAMDRYSLSIISRVRELRTDCVNN